METKTIKQILFRFAAALLIAVSSMVALPRNARAEQITLTTDLSYELPPVVDAADVVPAPLRESPNYQIAQDVSIIDNFYHFHLTTNTFGAFDVGCLDLLQVRIYETNVLAGVPEISGSAEFGKAATANFTETAKGTLKTVVTPIKSVKAFALGVEEDSRVAFDFIRMRKRNQPKDSMFIGEEKRRQAHSLGLDVYSTNPAVQEYLTNLAKARSPGSAFVNVGLSVTTFVIPFSTPISLAISAGKYREKLNDKFDTLPPIELYHMNDKILKKMNIHSDQREQFLEYGELTPRQKTEIIADLKTLELLTDWQPFLDACRNAHPPEGVWQLQCADMLAKYDKTIEQIQLVVSAGTAVQAITVTGRQVIFLPADSVFWSESTAKAFEPRVTATLQTAQQDFVTSGHVTDRAKKEIESRGYSIRESFLHEEMNAPPEIKPTETKVQP